MATHFSLPSPSLTFVNRVACAVTISVLRHCHSEAGAAEADEHNADRTQNLDRSSLALGNLSWCCRLDSLCQVISPEKHLPWPLPF